MSLSLALLLPWLPSTKIAIARDQVLKRRVWNASTRADIAACEGPAGVGIADFFRRA